MEIPGVYDAIRPALSVFVKHRREDLFIEFLAAVEESSRRVTHHMHSSLYFLCPLASTV
jgi:hypothetical protein